MIFIRFFSGRDCDLHIQHISRRMLRMKEERSCDFIGSKYMFYDITKEVGATVTEESVVVTTSYCEYKKM
jgi:hypothetical protein